MSPEFIVGGIYVALWLFFIYAFAGVLVEMLYCWTIEYRGVVESRLGLLYLPFNLLYGAGGLIITLALLPYFDNPFVVFGLGLVVGTVLEYFTSLFMEKAFGAVYWDYSKEFLNIQGRVCLKYALMWGGLSLVLLYVLDVVNVQILLMIPVWIGLPVLGLLIVATILSVILTLLAYRRTAQKNAYLRAKRDGKDATLPNPAWARLVDRLVPDSVLINTFPRMSLITEYQELSGHHRKLIVWLPTIGKPTQKTVEAGERARDQETNRLLAAGF
ncbi:putative membrane protein [Microbacteriaceae bacterium SG_E_30_P1]|uniref:Membrane protein n=1 Tax=Antiquaquibacter oligotrophicus TaxID=2880260 RepID=A0ABT6KJY2_9MICO|nr:putative ABC transporter permease [Antiquaquibacter oligotrophicus]MDH6180124.1 putative membrane protein [Antiquaquibacter oligotrophicus]UDF14125.1 putative ABC transporter permease [Antiquaquibacter oligotrophicus]